MRLRTLCVLLGTLGAIGNSAFATAEGSLSARLDGTPGEGRTIDLSLEAPLPDADVPGRGYVILMGMSGSRPGFDFGSVHVPLNYDALTRRMWEAALCNLPVQKGLIGWLDVTGAANAAVYVPADIDALLEALGIQLTFAAVGVDFGSVTPTFAAGPAEVDFTRPAVQ